MDVASIIIGLLVLAYVVFYIRGRYYLRDGFKDDSVGRCRDEKPRRCRDEKPRRPKVYMDDETYAPYTTAPVMNLGDFEENLIYQNENDREISGRLRDKLMSQYPMDWSGMPPSSAQFQAGLRETFVDTPQNPVSGEPPAALREMESTEMQPPDMDSVEQEERKLLQMYQPRNVADKTTYDIDDARELIDKIYDEKGLIPQIHHKRGSQVYEIIGVWKKDDKVVYEEDEQEAEASGIEANKCAGENTIHVTPSAVSIDSPSNDPYFDDSERTRRDKWDYTKWTPGLERMFAPTYPKKDWY
jgi:hypothetical protein